MVWRYLRGQDLRSKLLLHAAVPTLLCLLVMSLGFAWVEGEQQRIRDRQALDLAAARTEMRLGALRDRLRSLAELAALDTRLVAALDAGGPVEPALLAESLRALRRAEPLVGSLRIEAEEAADREGACASDRAGGCAPGIPALRARAPITLEGGRITGILADIPLEGGLLDWLGTDRREMLGLAIGGEAWSALPALPPGPLAEWAPGWLATALEDGQEASGLLPLDGRPWLARTLPVAETGPARATLLVMLPPGAAGGMGEGTLATILIPAGIILALSLAALARGAHRLGRAMSQLGEALRSLGRGDSAVVIPPAPPGSPREVEELMAACVLLRDGVAERSRMSERLRWLANFDGLTGLPNRALLGDRLELAFSAAHRDGTGLAVLALDLDHFKEVNDTLGHAAGDEVLRVIAARLRGCLRATDTLARTGGDEFVLVAPELDKPEMLATFAQRLLDAVGEPVPVGGDHRTLGLSIGAAVMEPGHREGRPQSLLQDADLALYQAKAEGRSCLRVFEPSMDERLRTRRALVADLRNAVADRELVILFQPQVSTATRRITGAEALLRWHHPTRGPIAPDVFIPLAEETGLIVPIGAWVLEEACHVARGWGAPHLAVNVSAIQVRQPSFVATVEGALARSGLPAARLELEITEAAMLANSEDTLSILSRLRSLGVRLAMDDFGTGYSSLATLQRFRFDKIKVDRSFIRNLAHDPRAVALLRAVIAMGGALDVRTNAEGVEDEEQLQLLCAEGCDEAQGFLFGRPMSAAAFQAQLGRERLEVA